MATVKTLVKKYETIIKDKRKEVLNSKKRIKPKNLSKHPGPPKECIEALIVKMEKVYKEELPFISTE